MAVDVERIIQSIKAGDQDSVQSQLTEYNAKYAECFFFNAEEKERRKQQELEEFRRNKVREYVPNSDSDFDSDDSEDSDLVLRRRLAAALVWLIRTQLQPGVLKVCLRSLRILSRDRRALAPLVTNTALLTLAWYGGISALSLSLEEEWDAELYTYINEINLPAMHARSPAKLRPDQDIGSANLAVFDTYHVEATHPSMHCSPAAEALTSTLHNTASGAFCPLHGEGVQQAEDDQTFYDARRSFHDLHSDNLQAGAAPQEYNVDGGCMTIRTDAHAMLAQAKKDNGKDKEEEEEGKDDREVWRKEAMKALCNVIYNSQKAQERASALRLLSGLTERLKMGVRAAEPPSGQFYDMRLLFLLTALRPELRTQLLKEKGVSLLTAALEQCLDVHWGEDYEVLRDRTLPPVSREVSQRAMEILKTLFNITYISHRREPNEEEAAIYRHLAAVLRHCLLLPCDGEDRTEELQGHTVNVLSALPLQCLDVLLSVHLSEGSQEWEGMNMDCVHALLLFMQKRLERGLKLKEKLTPVLSLLTESCRNHRETRHYLKQQVLPPLRDVTTRPEQGLTVRGRLVRLMTHVDTDVKHCAAELLFVLCKENVSRFVKYTGYGNAAGLLAARGLLGGAARLGGGAIPESRYSSDSDSDTEEYREARGRINPVTGRVEEEQPDPMEGMTEEEKEEEACKLINMFNRLSRDNIIQPMGLTVDGRLAPLRGQMKDCQPAEDEEPEEESEDEVD